MKRITLILVLVFTIQLNYTYAWEWEEYGPPGIKANKICFFENINLIAMICVDTGMFIIADYSGQSWEFHNFQAVEAISPGFDSDSIIMVMNEGSYSDGIWSFNTETGQFNVIHWCYKPNFIISNLENNRFYVGYENGLLFSEDCITWSEVAFFSNTTCIDMEMCNGNLAVATLADINNTFFSDDYGTTWNQLENGNITELASSLSNIFGIVIGESWSSGFYEIDAYEMEWDNIFYSVKLNAIGTDNVFTPFVGWNNGVSPDEGIAKYKNSELVFYNDGLPNLNINSIASPGIVGATVIYCCTDGGTFKRILSVRIKENQPIESLSVFPNPVTNQTTIKLNLQEMNGIDNLIFIYNNQGKIVDRIRFETNNEIIWDRGNLPSGIYYMVVKIKKERLTRKFIIL